MALRAVDEAAPPQTMAQCLQQAQGATMAAIENGTKLVEVEFPPLPADVLEAAETSAYDVSRANTELAIKFASALRMPTAVVYPDAAELERSVEDCGTDQPAPNVTLHALRRPFVEAANLGDALLGLIGRGDSLIKAIDDVEAYVCLTFSAQELPDLEKLCELEEFRKPVILFNLKLDTQRGDLGLPAFPGKDLQWRFLSRVKPAYYLRTRQYSLSLPTPPFILNYQGAIFRCYPGKYQSLLDTGGGAYRCVKAQDQRPALGEFKDTLTSALKFEDSKMQKFARTGYKAITWWEEDKDNNELFSDWRH
ncbi:hypothetical protein CTAYLR_005691 [Chrysophaeum taylorii]|uniref:DUF1995 domain-containing protein n=1 Tax=Chrysophaeum taylorii TaxID=2483200 RepID=A0AAD7XML2_9STRA|nr:hypothetical protein CTAYLR_005691 [Chrysophaeum taylorii]